MARSIGGGVAEGIEAGFNMGVRADELALRKKAEERADETARMARGREDRNERRQNVRDNIDLLGHQEKTLTSRQQEIVTSAGAAQAAGLPVSQELADEHGRNTETLAQVRQNALNFFSRAAAGQLNPLDAPPAELYTNLVAATGRPIAELKEAPKHIADVTAGLETGNTGLVVQGVNGLMAPQLRRGVGEASPHGGKIVRKEIIGLDPAVDANHNPLPGKFMPRLRVYVAGEDGAEKYYDAPMTVDGSGEPGAQVAVIDVKNSMNWMGNLGTLAEAMNRPDFAAKVAEGEKLAGAKAKRHLDELTAVSKPKSKGVVAERIEAIESFAKKNGITTEEAAERLQGMGVLSQGSALAQKLAAIDDLPITDEEKTKLKRDVTLGSGGRTTGLIPQKPGKTGAGGGASSEASLSKKFQTDKTYAQQVDFWADLLAKGGTLPPRFAQSGAGKEMFSDIVQRVPQLSSNANEVIANQAEVGGIKAGARAVGTRAANFTMAKNEAYEMADLVTDASSRVNRTSFAPINKALNAFNTNTGDTGIREFGAALNSFINAYARAVSPVGSPTVSDKEHAREMLSTADSHKQVVAIMEQLKKEMVAAGRAPKAARDENRSAARELDGGGPKPTGAAPAGQFTVGKTYVDGQGRKAVYQADGTWKAAP